MPSRGLIGSVLKRDPYVGVVGIALAVPLEHQHPDSSFGRVGPALRAERAAVSERTRRQDAICGHTCRVFDYGEAETPRHTGSSGKRAGLLARHLRYGLRLEDPLTVEDALVEHHLIETGDVFRSRKQSGAAERWTCRSVTAVLYRYGMVVSSNFDDGAFQR